MSNAPFAWTSNARSDPGLVREANEDACLDRPDLGLWAVADGMGGHSAGDVAANAIVERLGRIASPSSLSGLVTNVELAVLEVNARLRELGRRPVQRTIGSTVAILAAYESHGVCVWAGDSRIYRYRQGALEQLTQDHALVEDLIEQGYLQRADAALHPQSNLVTRAVGATEDLRLDLEIVELADQDVFVLCSDGLDKEVSDEDIAAALANGSRSSEWLVELALERGGRDNVTVVLVEVRAAADGAPAPDARGVGK
jgi:protein phosphatase